LRVLTLSPHEKEEMDLFATYLRCDLQHTGGIVLTSLKVRHEELEDLEADIGNRDDVRGLNLLSKEVSSSR